MSRSSHMNRAGIVALLVSMLASAASAAALSTHANAFNNGSGPDGGYWRGSSSFSFGTLQGYVEWAVFGPGQFPYAGYTPTPGELTYAYQVFETDVAPLSTFALALENQADNIGSFGGLPGQVPDSATIVPLAAATWRWQPNGIPLNGFSNGLAFSSTQIPQNFFAGVVDHGQSGFFEPLPSPSAISIPEPTGMMFVLATLGLKLAGRRRRD